MPKAYSNDLRERVVAAVLNGGLSCHRVAALFDVAASTAVKWVQRFRETGVVSPGQIGGHRPRRNMPGSSSGVPGAADPRADQSL